MFSKLNGDVEIVEVGPRDGLQNEKQFVETKDKFQYIQLLGESGLKQIELTSFVSPKAIPQMKDSLELADLAFNDPALKNIQLPCLVPNLKGYENAKKKGVTDVSLFTATSDAFNMKNINTDVEGSFERLTPLASQAKADGKRIRGYISTAFGCPYQGEMSVESLIKVTEKLLALDVDEISIGDTIGVATPVQVASYLDEVLKVVDSSKVAMHFHDTRGMALSNILVSLEKGIRIFDASSGGLGGCPYAKGATGNVATEDVLYLFESYGLNAGVDMGKLATASEFILSKLGRKTQSKFLTAYLNQK